MNKKLVACIGSGNMGGALMTAAASKIGGGEILLTDYDPDKAASLAAKLGASAAASNAEAVAGARFVFLAVKPQVLASVLSPLAPVLADLAKKGAAPVLVSIVAGASIAAIRGHLESGIPASPPGAAFADYPIVRLMPNTPALIAEGMIAMAAPATVAAPAVAELEGILAASGLVDRVDEHYMDAVTALSGSGPAFVYIFIEALADAGVRAGLPRDKALRYAARTVAGSALMVEKTGQHPGALKDAVCSPAGTTIAGVAALEDRGFRAAAMAAVDAAFKRAKGL